MLDSGVKVGLGVDGSASNDSGHLLEEARHAMLLQRVSGNPAGLSAREALALATRGSAAVLGRDDIGQLAPGMAADFAAYRLDQLGYAGGLHDPLAALLFCRPQNADLVMVQGKMVVKDGQLLTVDAPALIAEHNRRSLALVRGE
jgi:8-oxoguanine deaminase